MACRFRNFVKNVPSSYYASVHCSRKLASQSMRSGKLIIAPPRPSAVPMFVWLTMAFSTFQGRSSRASSFYASLLQTINDVMSLTLCPWVVSQALQHFRSSGRTPPVMFFCSPVIHLVGHLPWLWHIQESMSTDVLEGGCWTSTHASLGFPFHFSLFVASSLKLSHSATDYLPCGGFDLIFHV